MSTPPKVQRTTVPAIRARKGGQPLVCLTAYTTTMARLLDPLVDVLLVGDSLGMVVYGFDSTLPVTLEHTIAHTRAVVRGASHACVIADLPFGSYQESPEAAFRTSARVMAETGCAGIKLEGGAAMAPTVRFLVERGIPVMGHVGLLPQSFNLSGGFGTRGRTAAEARHIQADAKAVAEAGAFALVVEGVVEPLARRITEAVPVPTIGIGASVACDGQILVAEDLLGLFREFKPKFVKRYAELGGEIERAVSAWAADVRERRFPGPEQVFAPRPEARAASARPRLAKSGKPR